MDAHPEEDSEPAETALGIVVTAPSSPEQKALPPPLDGHSQEHSDPFELSFVPLDTLSVPLMSASPPAPRFTPFEQAMANATLPEPGPAYFAARQALWRTVPGAQSSQPTTAPRRSKKLQSILQADGPLDTEKYWSAGLEKVWKGLIGGQKLKERLPLRDLIKILQAGWIHDGTWPKGQVAPEPDDEARLDSTSVITTAATSRVPTPQSGKRAT
ncbi:hypothetical protein PsYK624_010780 [Phanerochaete sordida]|uniref:DUF4050 domain-containing protein n=1 Tax=Phanerochaete sordida TaxID=48140 RepID=A0A9P3L7F2_9APHY|nr:hypothetical protein PsYK624_010780 [Phanerochaete sordida]